MSRNARNTRFFWLMLVLLGLAAYTAIMFSTTIDNCGRNGAKRWEYLPPHWVCVNG